MHPLQQQLRQLQRRAWHGWVLYNVCWLLAFVIGVTLLMAVLDYVTGIDDPGLRVLAWLVRIGVIVWAVYRFLLLPMLWRPTPSEMAARVEDALPQLRGRLVSAIEFLHGDARDPMVGSPALQQASIHRTEIEASGLDFRVALKRLPWRRALAVVAVVAITVQVLWVALPDITRVALARVQDPFGRHPWPQRTNLAVRPEITRIARGEPFEIEAFDRYRDELPDEVWLEYRPVASHPNATSAGSSPPAIQREPMRPLEPPTRDEREDAKEVRFVRFESIQQPFAYRVVGGDDHSMVWQTVEVVDPAVIAATELTVAPPPCTGWPRAVAPRQLRALVGSRWSLRAESSLPLRRAALQLDSGRRIPVDLSPSGRHLSITQIDGDPPMVEQSWEGELVFTDVRGVAGHDPRRFRIRAITDQPPSVHLLRPRGPQLVTPRATLSIAIEATDDLAVRELRWEYAPSNMHDAQGPADADRGAAVTPRGSLRVWHDDHVHPPSERAGTGPGAEPDRREAEADWPLAPLDLAPGMTLNGRAVATTYCGQSTDGPAITINVVTREQLLEHLAAREDRLIEQLRAAVARQQDARTRVAAIRRTNVPALYDPRDVDRLRAAELTQQQVDRALTDPDQGIPASLADLLASLAANRLRNGELGRRLGALREELGRLDRDHLLPLRGELTRAIKLAEAQRDSDPPPDNVGEFNATLDRTLTHQQAVLDALGAMLDRLQRWEDIREIHTGINRLRQQQQAVLRDTAPLLRTTLGKRLGELSADQRAELDRLAGRQLALAHQLDRFRDQMDTAAQRLAAADPSGARSVQRAQDHLQRTAIGASMRNAADRLRSNRLQQSIDDQSNAADRLAQVLAMLQPTGGGSRGGAGEAASRAGGNGAEADDSSGGADGQASDAQGPAPGDLRRIRDAQQEMRRRTAELEVDRPTDADAAARQARRTELSRLARQQRELADTTVDLVPDQPTADPEPRDAPGLDALVPDAEPAAPEGPAHPPTDEHPLVRIAGQMRIVAGRLARADIGAPTLDRQQGIIAAIDELIEQLEQQRGSSTDGQSTAEGSSGDTAATDDPSTSGQPGSQTGPPDGQSTEQIATDDRPVREIIEEAWNRLPLQQRQQLMQLPIERFLPQYESEIEAYFRRLSRESATPRGPSP